MPLVSVIKECDSILAFLNEIDELQMFSFVTNFGFDLHVHIFVSYSVPAKLFTVDYWSLPILSKYINLRRLSKAYCHIEVALRK